MDKKFFVPFGTAKQLRKKGYNEKISYAYNKGRRIVRAGVIDCNNTDWDNLRKVQSSYPPRLDYIAAPTYHEVVDWLWKKGKFIFAEYRAYENDWAGFIGEINGEMKYLTEFPTREEALNVGILKALEML